MLRQLSASLNYGSEHTVSLLFKLQLSTYFTPPDYPIYCKDGISPSFYLGLIFTSLIRCYKHHLFFQLLLDSTIFSSYLELKNSRNFAYFRNWGINVMTVVLPFRSYSYLIYHSCFKNASHFTLRIAFNFADKISLNFNLSLLSNLSPPRNMAQTLLP